MADGVEHLRRRLQLHRRAYRRRSRVRRQLLPLLRSAPGSIWLALPGDLGDDRGQPVGAVDASARVPAGPSRMVADLARGDPAPRPDCPSLHPGIVVGSVCVPGHLDAVQQRLAPRTRARDRRAAHLVLRRPRHRHRSVAAAGDRFGRCRLHPRARTGWPDGRRVAARRNPPTAATSGRTQAPRRAATAADAHPCRGNIGAVQHLCRSDPLDDPDVVAGRLRGGADARVVAGTGSVLLPHAAHSRRHVVEAVRHLDGVPVPDGGAAHVAAPPPADGYREGAHLAPGRRCLRLHVLLGLHPHQVDPPPRCLRRYRCGTGRRSGCDDGACSVATQA